MPGLEHDCQHLRTGTNLKCGGSERMHIRGKMYDHAYAPPKEQHGAIYNETWRCSVHGRFLTSQSNVNLKKETASCPWCGKSMKREDKKESKATLGEQLYSACLESHGQSPGHDCLYRQAAREIECLNALVREYLAYARGEGPR